MNVNVTKAQLESCINVHKEVLVNMIRECGRSSPPADGAIATMVNTLEVLGKMIPMAEPYKPAFVPGEAVIFNAELVEVVELEDHERRTRIKSSDGYEWVVPTKQLTRKPQP